MKSETMNYALPLTAGVIVWIWIFLLVLIGSGGGA